MRTRPPPRSEAIIVQEILDHVEALPRGHARKVHGSRYQSAGEPDVDAVVDGRSVKCEVKMPGEEPTPLQYASLRKWERAGALAIWATSLHQFCELLDEHLGDTHWRNPQICKHRHATEFEVGQEVCDDCGYVFEPRDERRL